MHERASAEEIQDRAAAWAAEAGPAMAPDRRRQLNDWLAADLRHAGAFARAQAILFQARAALGRADLAAERTGAPSPGRRPRPRTRRELGWMAAGLAGAALAGVYATSSRARTYSTRKGEMLALSLPGDIDLTLNTESEVSILEGGSPQARLRAGEIFFECRRSGSSLLTIATQNSEVRVARASGALRRQDGAADELLVRSGQVWLAPRGLTRGPPVPVPAGAVAECTRSGGVRTAEMGAEKVERAMSWRQGMLAFEDERLVDAAADYARYSDYRIEVSPDVAQERVTGLFPTSDPRAFAETAARALGLTARPGAGKVTISRRSEG